LYKKNCTGAGAGDPAQHKVCLCGRSATGAYFAKTLAIQKLLEMADFNPQVGFAAVARQLQLLQDQLKLLEQPAALGPRFANLTDVKMATDEQEEVEEHMLT